MSARLVPLSGAAPVIQLRRPVQLVGRHPECDLRIENIKVSRRHCCLALVYDRVVIRDLGSRNAIRVNGVVVDEATLVPGDEVAIGPLLYRVEGVEDAAAAVPAPASKAAPTPASKAAPVSPPSREPKVSESVNLPEIDPDSNGSNGDLVPLLDI